MIDYINTIRRNIKDESPLIHCITNPISINQCANAILALGARPIMAEHPKEAGEITKSAKALLLNLGNITDVRMESMIISAEAAKTNNIPVVIDAVGVACSELRRSFIRHLLKHCTPTVIKGNYSEINALYDEGYKSEGVDADKALDIKNVSKTAVKLSNRLNTIILASGKTDIIADGNKVMYILNGTEQLSRITGTGCMLGALTACCLTVCAGLHAAATACAVLGICGELAATDKGGGNFMTGLMDKLSTLTDGEIEKYLKAEVKEIEKV